MAEEITLISDDELKKLLGSVEDNHNELMDKDVLPEKETLLDGSYTSADNPFDDVVDSRDIGYYERHKKSLPARTRIKVRAEDYLTRCPVCGKSTTTISADHLGDHLYCGHIAPHPRRRAY